VKKLLSFLTCLYFIPQVCGSIILGVSIWIRVSGSQQVNACSHTSTIMFAGVNLLIAVGAIIMVLGFLGCCGAIKESRCMLMLFFIGLLLIVILQITGGVLGAVYRSQVESALNNTLRTSVDALQSTSGAYKEYQEEFQKFERENQCCGLLEGPEDWGQNFNKPSSIICQCETETSSSDLCTYYQGRYIYQKPCGEVIMKKLKDNLIIIMGISFGLAVIEILGLVFSMTLYCQIGRK
ncbi:TSN8 protein, partial [Oreocharis arfaki]|nr:TSN8 protein [Oreocharis arfaki]